MPFETILLEAAKVTCDYCNEYELITEDDYSLDSTEEVCGLLGFIYIEETGAIYCCEDCKNDDE